MPQKDHPLHKWVILCFQVLSFRVRLKLTNPLKVVREMNNYDLWKWAAGKRTEKDKNETYSAKNWWYVLLMLGVFVGIMLLYYLISVLWN